MGDSTSERADLTCPYCGADSPTSSGSHSDDGHPPDCIQCGKPLPLPKETPKAAIVNRGSTDEEKARSPGTTLMGMGPPGGRSDDPQEKVELPPEDEQVLSRLRERSRRSKESVARTTASLGSSPSQAFAQSGDAPGESADAEPPGTDDANHADDGTDEQHEAKGERETTGLASESFSFARAKQKADGDLDTDAHDRKTSLGKIPLSKRPAEPEEMSPDSDRGLGEESSDTRETAEYDAVDLAADLSRAGSAGVDEVDEADEAETIEQKAEKTKRLSLSERLKKVRASKKPESEGGDSSLPSIPKPEGLEVEDDDEEQFPTLGEDTHRALEDAVDEDKGDEENEAAAEKREQPEEQPRGLQLPKPGSSDEADEANLADADFDDLDGDTGDLEPAGDLEAAGALNADGEDLEVEFDDLEPEFDSPENIEEASGPAPPPIPTDPEASSPPAPQTAEDRDEEPSDEESTDPTETSGFSLNLPDPDSLANDDSDADSDAVSDAVSGAAPDTSSSPEADDAPQLRETDEVTMDAIRDRLKSSGAPGDAPEVTDLASPPADEGDPEEENRPPEERSTSKVPLLAAAVVLVGLAGSAAYLTGSIPGSEPTETPATPSRAEKEEKEKAREARAVAARERQRARAKRREAADAASAALHAATQVDTSDPALQREVANRLAEAGRHDAAADIFGVIWRRADDPTLSMAISYLELLDKAGRHSQIRRVSLDAIQLARASDQHDKAGPLIDQYRATLAPKATELDRQLVDLDEATPLASIRPADSADVDDKAWILSEKGSDRRYAFNSTSDWKGTWRDDLAAWTLCQLIACGFEIPRTRKARLSRARFEALVEGDPATEKLDWRTEASEDGTDREYLYGSLRDLPNDTVRWPIEEFREWRPWLRADDDPALLDQSLEEGLAGFIDLNDGARHRRILREAEEGGLETIRPLAAQLSSIVVFDYLTNNWARFERDEADYGAANHFADGDFVTLQTPAVFQLRNSRRVKGRFLWVSRFSRDTITSLRLLDRETVSRLLYPEPSAVERKKLEIFWEQRGRLLERVDRLVGTYGAEAVLAFD